MKRAATREVPELTLEQLVRFRSRIDWSGDCWLWTGGQFRPSGYGIFNIGRAPFLAHRVAYAIAHPGVSFSGSQIDHLCHDETCIVQPCPHRLCVRASHLAIATARGNTLRGNGLSALNARKTHCPAGHPLSGPNLSVTCGRRVCKTCRRESSRRYRARLYAAAASDAGAKLADAVAAANAPRVEPLRAARVPHVSAVPLASN